MPGDPEPFVRPGGIAVDARGAVYVTDSANHRVKKFGPQVSARKRVFTPDAVFQRSVVVELA